MERSEIAVTTETVPVPSYAGMIAGYRQALQIVDDVVLKNYLTRLSELEVVPLDLDTLRHSEKQNVLFCFSINRKSVLCSGSLDPFRVFRQYGDLHDVNPLYTPKNKGCHKGSL